jgi:hypothetical protein
VGSLIVLQIAERLPAGSIYRHDLPVNHRFVRQSLQRLGGASKTSAEILGVAGDESTTSAALESKRTIAIELELVGPFWTLWESVDSQTLQRCSCATDKHRLRCFDLFTV